MYTKIEGREKLIRKIIITQIRTIRLLDKLLNLKIFHPTYFHISRTHLALPKSIHQGVIKFSGENTPRVGVKWDQR